MGTVQATLARCREVLARHYGSRLGKAMRYGSAARGSPSPESDLDLLVVLEDPVDVVAEARRLADRLHPVQLESEHYISAKAASAEEYEAGRLQRPARRGARVTGADRRERYTSLR